MLRFANRSTGHPFRHILALGGLTAWCGLLFFYHFDRRGLWSSHEGRAGQHAQMMIDTGDWGMPRLYWGRADYQKPPLYYWMVAGMAQLSEGKVDPWSIRFPAAAAALAGVWLTYALGCSMWRPRIALMSALMLACSMRYCWLARVGRIDMPLTLAISLALACFWLAYRRIRGSDETEILGQPASKSGGKGGQAPFVGRAPHTPLPPLGGGPGWGGRPVRAWGWMLPAYLAAAVAVMLKGPVGLMLPAVSIGLFLTLERQPIWPWQSGFCKLAHRTGLWWGIPLLLAVAAPWFVWATITTEGAFFKTFFWHHNLERTLGAAGLKPQPVWYYLPQIFGDLFPWSALVPAAIVAGYRQGRRGQDPALRFVLSWVVGMFLVLSLVRFKRHDYLLPLLPGFALLLGGFWAWLTGSDSCQARWRWARVQGWFTIGIAVALVAVMAVLADARMLDFLLQDTSLGPQLDRKDRLIVDRLHDALRDHISLVIVLGGVVLVASVVGLAALRTRRPLVGVCMVAVLWSTALWLYVDCVLPPIEPLRDQQHLAHLARRFCPQGRTLYYYGREDHQLLFWLGPPVQWLPDRTYLRSVMERSEPVFVLAELDRFLRRQQEWPDVAMIPMAKNTDNAFRIHQCPMVLVTNRPGWGLVQTQRRKITRRNQNVEHRTSNAEPRTSNVRKAW